MDLKIRQIEILEREIVATETIIFHRLNNSLHETEATIDELEGIAEEIIQNRTHL